MNWRGWLVILLIPTIILGSILFYIIIYPGQTSRRFYRSELFGICEPITARHVQENLSLQQSFEALQSLGVKRLREWTWMNALLVNPTTLNQTFAETLNHVLSTMAAGNITVMGMAQDFPSWMTDINGDYQAVPRRDTAPGSDYMKFLEKYRLSWRTLAAAFPNITFWEIGNEFNINEFLHPPDFHESNFSLQEKADISTDLLYYGSLGVHEGKPEAKTVLGGLAPDPDISGIAVFLEKIYKNIKSGRWPSTTPNDYFQIACWHPYIPNKEPTVSNWVNPNRAVYNVMDRYGDSDKPVFFSEFGYSDNSTSQENISNYLLEAFKLASAFPWLETIYWFRLIDPEPATVSINNPQGYGLIKLDWTWKLAAYTYQSLIKGRDDFQWANLLLNVAETPRKPFKRLSN